ncbi:MAG: hypothetical protein ACO394_14575 [Blastocatellia bacterium]
MARVNHTQRAGPLALASLLHRAWFGRGGWLLRSPIYRWWWRWKRDESAILAGPLRGYGFPDLEITARLGIADLPVQRWLCHRLLPGDTAYLYADSLGLISLLAAARVGPRGNVYGMVPQPGTLPRLAELRGCNRVENLHLLPLLLEKETTTSGFEAVTSAWIPPRRSLDLAATQQPPPDLVYLAPVSETSGIESILGGASHLLSNSVPHTWIIQARSPVEAHWVEGRLREARYDCAPPSAISPLLVVALRSL